MGVDSKSIKKLISLMRNQGVLTLKTPEIELSLSPGALFPKSDKDTSKPESKTTETEYGTDAALLWSVPGYVPDEVAG